LRRVVIYETLSGISPLAVAVTSLYNWGHWNWWLGVAIVTIGLPLGAHMFFEPVEANA
jgi:hypothetical protein